MRYVRKKTNTYLVSKVLNFNQKALPDPNAKYTTMNKFLRNHEIKGKFIRFRNATFKLIDDISRSKSKKTSTPIVYSEKNGYQNKNEKEVLPKKENLVIPLIND